MNNTPIIVVSALSALLFFVFMWKEAEAKDRMGTVILALLAVVAVACVVMSAIGVGCPHV